MILLFKEPTWGNYIQRGAVYVRFLCLSIKIASDYSGNGVATGGQGGQIASLTAKNREKEGENQEKEEKIGKERKNRGGFFHFAPPDR